MAKNGFSLRLDKIASKEALDFMSEFPDLMGEVSEIALFRIANELRNDAGERAPYITGTLKRSLTTKQRGGFFKESKNRVETGTNLVYARSAEHRARSSARRFFFKKAYEKQKAGRAEKIFKEEIDSIIK